MVHFESAATTQLIPAILLFVRAVRRWPPELFCERGMRQAAALWITKKSLRWAEDRVKKGVFHKECVFHKTNPDFFARSAPENSMISGTCSRGAAFFRLEKTFKISRKKPENFQKTARIHKKIAG
jgi:hypothetical protein